MDISISFEAFMSPIGLGQDNGINFSAFYDPILGCTGLGGVGNLAPQGGILTDIMARVTLLGRQLIARSLQDGTSIQVVEMALGTGGYDPANPTQALVIDNTAIALSNEIFRKPIDVYENPTAISSKAFTARFSAQSFAGAVGEIGLFAQILHSPTFPAEVGSKFLFAIAHQGLNTKTFHHVQTYRIFVTI